MNKDEGEILSMRELIENLLKLHNTRRLDLQKTFKNMFDDKEAEVLGDLIGALMLVKGLESSIDKIVEEEEK
jgi:hypothetical protein